MNASNVECLWAFVLKLAEFHTAASPMTSSETVLVRHGARSYDIGFDDRKLGSFLGDDQVSRVRGMPASVAVEMKRRRTGASICMPGEAWMNAPSWKKAVFRATKALSTTWAWRLNCDSSKAESSRSAFAKF